jgi:hypothetical protein
MLFADYESMEEADKLILEMVMVQADSHKWSLYAYICGFRLISDPDDALHIFLCEC